MNFIFSRGIDCKSLSLPMAVSIGPVTLMADRIVQSGGSSYVFDGQTSVDGRFRHSLREGVSGFDPSNAECGVFCLGCMRPGGPARFWVDPLSQYPLYHTTTANGYLVSNSIQLVRLVLETNGGTITHAHRPALDHLVHGGVLGTKTHYAEIHRLPFGQSIVADERLSFVAVPEQRLASNYQEALQGARRSISAHIRAVAEAVDADDTVLCDITGGSDSRAVLSFLQASPLASRLSGRCLTQYPHPDANVAGLIMSKWGIPRGSLPVPQNPIEASLRINAALFGGGRNVEGGVPARPSLNLVHFRGVFGELSGTTPGIDYVAAALGSGEYSHANAVDVYLSWRRKAKALDLITGAALSEVRSAMIESVQELSKQYPLDHVIAEQYLRTRCRTHFGWLTYLYNRYFIAPDPLANVWIREARRHLPATLHTENQVMFDLIRGHDPELTYVPLARTTWSQEIVPPSDRDHFGPMEEVSRETEALSDLTGPLVSKVPVPGFPVQPLLGDRSTLGRAENPHERKIELFKRALSFVLDAFPRSDDFWDRFARETVEEYATRPASEFRALAISTHAMGIVAATAFAALDFGVDPLTTAAPRPRGHPRSPAVARDNGAGER